MDIVFEPFLKKITLSLLVLWCFRDYIYYGSLTILPEMKSDSAKNLILISISETVAVLMSYPIRSKIRRVNTFFTLVLVITISSLICSFTVLEDCTP